MNEITDDATNNTLNDHDLIGYLLGALDAAEHAAAARQIQERPETAVRLQRLRKAFLPLEAIRDSAPAPIGLTERTLARLQSHLAGHETNGVPQPPDESLSHLLTRTLELPPPAANPADVVAPAAAGTRKPAPRELPETRFIGGRLRPDLIVGCAIAFLAVGLLFSAIGKLRAQSQLLACQSNLRTLYTGLVGYADTHGGQYPQISADATAASFATALEEAGQVPAGFVPGCPVAAVDDAANPVHYTYTLGFHNSSGGLSGLHQPVDSADEHDLLPISADYPTESATPFAGPLCAHPPIMNVLYAGGNVRSTTSALIGPNGDDIYRNVNGQVAAGINRMDVVLGRPEDKP